MSTDHENNQEPVSIAKTMFFGHFDEDEIFPFPEFTEEQKEMAKEMANAVNRYAEEKIDSEKLDQESRIPEDVLQGLAQLGLCGLGVPEELNGLGLDYTLYSRVFSEIAGNDGSIATMLGAHQSIGYRALILEGSEEQKNKWLPQLATGEKIAAFCLTEPGSGSDAYSIKTKAVDNGDGTFTINGQKLWITNGGRADFYSVFCKTDHTVDGETKEKISCFIVEKEMEGVSFGEKEDKMGIRASETRAVYFDNVKVPASNIIGEPGKGFKLAMNVLNSGRLSLGSGSVGGMKAAFKLATEHAKNRKQFGDVIANYGLIQEKLTKIACNIYSAESLVYKTTGRMDRGMKDSSIESAICKVYCSEALWESIDQCLQIAAGNGYMREYPYERMMRDSRINLIFEGTNEILRIFIALSGIKEPSESLKELGKLTDVSKVLSDPIKSLGILTDFFVKKKISRMFSSKTLTKVHPSFTKQANQFASMVNEFGIEVENTLIKLGKSIIGNEMPQKRLADMVINLYVMACVLSRTTAILNNAEVSESDKEYVTGLTELICRDCRQAFIRSSKRIHGNYDRMIPKVSQAVCERDGYGLDVIDF